MKYSELNLAKEGLHYIAAIKPFNMLVVKGRGAKKPTLLDLAIKKFGMKIRPVHRLDKVTYGVCIMAKDLFGQQTLSEAFRKHLVDKRYLAIVEGVPTFTSLSIDTRLERVDKLHKKKSPMAHQTISDDGKHALTNVKFLCASENFSVIEAKPQTGRMHQIRAHLAHVGHPIVGDKQYGSKTRFHENAIALLAWSINFPAPKEGRQYISAPIPKEFAHFLEQENLDILNKLT